MASNKSLIIISKAKLEIFDCINSDALDMILSPECPDDEDLEDEKLILNT